MRTLASFQNVHQGETIVVCGCGVSLNEFIGAERFVTIGVNDVGRRFQPNYLLVIDGQESFKGDRFHYIETSQAEYLFTDQELETPHPNVVKISLGQRDVPDFTNPDVLYYIARPITSPYSAMCLAAHMGASRIGLIGVDLTDHHFFAPTGNHHLSNSLISIDERFRQLGSALLKRGVKVFNLSRVSRLTAFPKMDLEDFAALPRLARGGLNPGMKPLRIISYAKTPMAGVPPILSRCINARTPHLSRSLWGTGRNGAGVVFEKDIDWTESSTATEAELREADVVIVHNGRVEPQHRIDLEGKAIVTLAHQWMREVDNTFVKQGFPGAVVGQWPAVLPEFSGWSIVPNPIPVWEKAFQPGEKGQIVTICYTPANQKDQFSAEDRLFWSYKGYDTTMRILEKLAAQFPVHLDVVRGPHLPHRDILPMKQRAHIVIDECVTGSYHRNSLEGLATGCVVVNAVGLHPGILQALHYCTGGITTNPFIFSTLDILEGVLTSLIGRGTDSLAKEGMENRQWMAQYWNFGWQWDQFWMPIIDLALRRAGREKGSCNMHKGRYEHPSSDKCSR